MSYDIHFYKSKLGKPDRKEARKIMEGEDSDDESESVINKEELAKALLDYNPRLERSDNEQDDSIELTTPEEDLAIQIFITDNEVALSIPYGNKDEEWDQVLDQSMEYQKVIARTIGYFVYDPQSGEAYDPLTVKTKESNSYRKIEGGEAGESLTKPWWKFW